MGIRAALSNLSVIRITAAALGLTDRVVMAFMVNVLPPGLACDFRTRIKIV